MGDQTNKVRRRPVDALFGEKEAAAPSYVVEPARPAPTISPPSPSKKASPPPPKAEPVAPAKAAPPANPTSKPEPGYTPPTFTPIHYEPSPESEEPSPYEPAAEDDLTFEPENDSPFLRPGVLDETETPPETPPEKAPAPTPTPMPTPTPADGDFSHLGEMIEQLYDRVTAELYDSPIVTDYCLKMLMQAREAYLRKDYATAEFYAESVGAKIKRSVRSVQATNGPTMTAIWVWEFVMLGVGGVLIALTYVPGLTLFGIPVAGDFAILLRAIGWGGVGGVIGALYNLPWFIQYREYDPAYNPSYFARPPEGMLIGAIMFLLSQAGILAGNTVIPSFGLTQESSISMGPVFLYLLSALAGFKQEYVFEFLDNILRMIFRIPNVPNELKLPTPPTIQSNDKPRNFTRGQGLTPPNGSLANRRDSRY